MRTLRILNLHCNKPRRNGRTDATVLAIDAAESFQIFGPCKMNYGCNWDINSYIQFNKEAVIKLYDEDLGNQLDYHILLRKHVVNEGQAGEGRKMVSLAADRAKYVLTYEIV